MRRLYGVRRWVIAAGLAAGLGACSAGGAPAVGEDSPLPRVRDGIEYRAEVEVLESDPVQLHAWVKIENRTDRDADLTFPDGCVVLLEARSEANGGGGAEWAQSRQVNCVQSVVPLRLEPGETREYAVQVSAAEILGDSLSAGRYRLTAVVRPRGVRVEVPAGLVDLANGSGARRPTS